MISEKMWMVSETDIFHRLEDLREGPEVVSGEV